MPEPDEWLMQKVAAGSAQHFEPLVRRYAHSILTFTTRLLPQRGEEAFQEIFLAVWARRHTYKFPMYFRPWLFRIAHNKCREMSRPHDFLAHRYEQEPDSQPLDRSHLVPAFPAPADAAIAVETSLLVEEAVARLPEQQRAIVAMRLWNEMSYTEIAEVLEVAESTVRSGMHYALETMRRHLEPRLR